MDNAALLQQLEKLVSEGRNPRTMNLDTLSSLELAKIINDEDRVVADAVAACIGEMAKTIDAVVAAFNKGARLIYIGAGTSGRLGVLDAVECRPTFSVTDNVVVGVIAGGEKALIHAVEGAEDNYTGGKQDLIAENLSSDDVVIGSSASGRTPYVMGALDYANELGCETACIVCNPEAPLLKTAQIGICATVGPECLTGSTRMKSGTAQKLIMNTISTASMVRIGKVYENLMVDVNATNEKLVARAIRIVMQATECSQQQAEEALEKANKSAKLAILMILTGQDVEQAKDLLDVNSGNLRKAICR
ncbi:N-acetylmuramic acid 6-phosphate etherase [Glaciecola sp. 1036]|uniref:N-acetylmuramic acid 6-phosphate etherase n=1 Tax=Alteromonadaceae TaxID=72275 RepID=UPI003D01FAB5